MDSHQKKDELGESLINSIIEPNTDIRADIGEIGLDHIFLKKWSHFLSGVKQADQEIQKKLKEAYTDPQAKQDLGEQLLMIIDRVETFKKIDALVKIFAAFVKGKITHKEFNQYSHVLENIDLNNLDVLAGFYRYKLIDRSMVAHYGSYRYNPRNQFISFPDDGSSESSIAWTINNERANDHYFIQNFSNVGLVTMNSDKDSKDFTVKAFEQLIQELPKILTDSKQSSSILNGIVSKIRFKTNNAQGQFFGGISVNPFGIKFLEILEIICKTEPKN